MRLRAHDAGLDLAVEIGRQHLRHPGVALDDGEHRVVADALAVELDRRDREAFLEHRGRRARHRARHPAADVVVMAEGLDVGDDLAVMKDRHRAAEIGQMADAAFGEIGVVHQEHVAGLHGVRRKIAHHRVRHRRIGAAGQLAAIAVEQADAKSCASRIIGVRAVRSIAYSISASIELSVPSTICSTIGSTSRASRTRRGRPGMRRWNASVHHEVLLRLTTGRITRMPCGSTSSACPGNTTVVEPNSSTTAGPSTRAPGGSDARS